MGYVPDREHLGHCPQAYLMYFSLPCGESSISLPCLYLASCNTCMKLYACVQGIMHGISMHICQCISCAYTHQVSWDLVKIQACCTIFTDFRCIYSVYPTGRLDVHVILCLKLRSIALDCSFQTSVYMRETDKIWICCGIVSPLWPGPVLLHKRGNVPESDLRTCLAIHCDEQISWKLVGMEVYCSASCGENRKANEYDPGVL